ncbi:MAG: thioredoxin family protein [Lachnospiraceae bacterium]|nr:thioredoxin family protein [Lachnospiraceae bacterium]
MKILDKIENLDEIIQSENLTILQFGSEACGPCYSITFKIDEWLKHHPNVVNRYIPIEEFQDVAAQHNIFTAPSTILFYDGKEIIRKSGYYSLDEIFLEAERILKIIGA